MLFLHQIFNLRVKSFKLLSADLNEYLKLNDHVHHLASFCNSILASLRKICNFTPDKLRKQLLNSLVLSRTEFSDFVFYPQAEQLLKHLQRIQYSAASFVTGRYTNSIETIVKLGCRCGSIEIGIF